MNKTCLHFPVVQVEIKYKRVYAVERLPYPGEGGPLHCHLCLQGIFDSVATDAEGAT